MWEGVDKTLLALGAASPTSALSKGFDSRVDTIDGFLDAFKLEPAADLSRRIEAADSVCERDGPRPELVRAEPRMSLLNARAKAVCEPKRLRPTSTPPIRCIGPDLWVLQCHCGGSRKHSRDLRKRFNKIYQLLEIAGSGGPLQPFPSIDR